MSTSVDVSGFELPLETPLSTARGDIRARRGFVVRGRVDGQQGVGEATPLPGWTESEDECRRALETVESLGGALSSTTLDDTPAARHAVALALFDARAREQGESLARFLAGPHAPVAETVPVNATVGDRSVEETVAAVGDAAEAGYECVKVKVGVGPVGRDVDRLVAAADSGVTLRADANGAWSIEEARTFLTGLEDRGVDLDYVEQPVGGEHIGALATLRAESAVGIAADESLAAKSVGAVLRAEAADVLVLKPMAMGGPARTLSAASRAAEVGVESVVTTTIDGVVARTAALHVAAALGEPPACGLATGGLLTRDLAPDPAPVVEGTMTLPAGPGLAGDAFDHLDIN